MLHFIYIVSHKHTLRPMISLLRCVRPTHSALCVFIPLSRDLVLSSYRFAGRPGDYVYVFGDYRMEEVRCTTHISDYCFVYVRVR